MRGPIETEPRFPTPAALSQCQIMIADYSLIINWRQWLGQSEQGAIATVQILHVGSHATFIVGVSEEERRRSFNYYHI